MELWLKFSDHCSVAYLDDGQRQDVAAGVDQQATVLEAWRVFDCGGIDDPQGALGAMLLVVVLFVAVLLVPPAVAVLPQQRV